MNDITGPHLRPLDANGPIPPQWQTLPAGTNHRGDAIELVCDPRRYDVLLVHSDQPGMFPGLPDEAFPDLMLDTLGVTGWEPLNWGGQPRLWLRDRDAARLHPDALIHQMGLVFEHRQAGEQPEVQFADVGPIWPFTRTTGPDMTPIPPLWVAEPAGESAGEAVEVVYNPARHEIMSFVLEPPSRAVLDELAAHGWQWAHANDSTHLFWRDRVRHVRAALERTGTEPATEIQGLGR